MNKIRLLILGSCVTRDILNYDADDQFELCGYYARSSFASSFCPVSSDDRFSQKIASKFQSAIVKADLTKTLQSSIHMMEFDLLSIDLIDERFSIFCENSGGIFTLSNELFSSSYTTNESIGVTIKPFTEEFYKLWEFGWERFINAIKSTNQTNKIVINKTFWSATTQTGRTYEPNFNAVQINLANQFLARLYQRISLDIPQSQFIEIDASLLQGADEHRWGISPFHYIDDYYDFMLKKLKSLGQTRHPKKIKEHHCYDSIKQRNPDRVIESGILFKNDSRIENSSNLDSNLFKGNAKSSKTTEGIKFTFTGSGDSHQVRFNLPKKLLVNGLNVKFRISEWATLKYLAIGYSTDAHYHHVKIVHPLREKWINFSLGYSDLSFGIQNNWQQPVASEALEVKLYFKGCPLPDGSTLEIEEIACWKESNECAPWLSSFGTYNQMKAREINCLPDIFITKIHDYLNKCFRDANTQVESFLYNGTCPLYGNKNLAWPSENTLPNTFEEVGTYRFSWHALHPAAMMMMHARATGNLTSVFSARDFISTWMERSYFSNDADKKFAWYDHGTAERLLSLILMWDLGAKYGFDTRFMSRLRIAIFKHGQLLASEMFYSSHQLSRYHNHAWFQDMALMAASIAMPEFPCAQGWMTTALTRLEDQLEKLIIRDNGYAVFVENSIGYHQGVQRLISFAGELAVLSGRQSGIPNIAEELIKFSETLKYPDNRAPAQGDTFRRSNPSVRPLVAPKPYEQSTAIILPQAGYAIIKGNHERCPYMLSMFATSLCQTHKHEDNLSFTLFMDGIEWLIDPSFYSHEYAKPQQKFLRSAWAHNNIAIKDSPYSIKSGCASLSGTINESSFTLIGSHTAYENIEVLRSITGSIDQLSFFISDSFTGTNSGDAFTLFHCGDEISVEFLKNGVCLSHPAANYKIMINTTSEATLVSGWNDEREMNAVTGLGFMESSPTSIIAFKLPASKSAEFSVFAIPANVNCNQNSANIMETKK